ncbi:alpha/beta fold hydrolase [Kineococcus sp. SYSU DK001]|uniref:alpha/beta fold hydrolase n=1 Tax=Kineococcus sp. SYSU DK001 TaxID=3383122 RepID=UPI003D7EAA98
MQIHQDAVTGTVEVAGQDVGWHDTGVPGGPAPVLLVHGTGGSAATHYRTVYPMLAARHRVLAVDLAPAAELEDIRTQVLAVLAERAPGQAVDLVGYSLGAVAAATLAAERPDLVRNLVLVCGWARTDGVQRLRNELWQRLFASDRESLARFSTFVAFGQSYLRARTDAEIAQLVAARTFPDGVEESMRLNARVDIARDLDRISAPTLVISGLEDQMVGPHHGRFLFGGIEDARLAEIETGHAATTERPAQVFKLIDDFLRRRPGLAPAGALVDTVAI